MRTIRTKVYFFNELSEKAKQQAVKKLSEISLNYDWWANTYEDAEYIGLKITSFNLDRNRHATGKFIQDAQYTANKILIEHGKNCETYKTASLFIQERGKLNIDEQDEELKELETEFLNDIVEDYSIILQNEYDYLQSDEAIIETIEENGYEFQEDGTRL
jgi:hypothetical protein